MRSRTSTRTEAGEEITGPTAVFGADADAAPMDTTEGASADRAPEASSAVILRGAEPAAGTSTVADRACGQVTFGAPAMPGSAGCESAAPVERPGTLGRPSAAMAAAGARTTDEIIPASISLTVVRATAFRLRVKRLPPHVSFWVCGTHPLFTGRCHGLGTPAHDATQTDAGRSRSNDAAQM
ncbi:hypothetical protein GCM10010129_44000 [Streptomyces fumigatiscleroticus]|nr:hypothetical protein GCM10010129_44000 [Streptomyces fumigatiscleroticus]